MFENYWTDTQWSAEDSVRNIRHMLLYWLLKNVFDS